MALQRISAERWKQLPSQLKERVQEHLLTLAAAGVAFFGFLAIIPSLVVIVSIYGLFADPTGIEEQVKESAGSLQPEAKAFVVNQLETITESTGSSLTIAVVVSTLVALWSASTGIANLMKGVSVASGATDYRNFAVRRGLALAMTLAASVFVAVALVTLNFLPQVLADAGLGSESSLLVTTLRLPVVALVLIVGLGVLYHYSQPEPHGRPALITWGSLVATGLWLIASLGFSWYTSSLANFNETYGSLGTIIVVLLWLWLSAITALLGAEIDDAFRTSEAEASSDP